MTELLARKQRKQTDKDNNGSTVDLPTREEQATEEENETASTKITNAPSETEWTIVVASNNAFYDVFLNWLGYFFRLHMKNKVIFVAEDDTVYEKAKVDFAENPQIRVERSGLALEDPDFHYKDRSDQGYKLMMSSRPTMLKRFLNEGLNILFSDADIIWFQNPIPHFVDKDGNRDYDIHFQRDGVDKVCGGFFGMMSNNRTKTLVSAWEATLLAKPRPNQKVLNRLLNSGKFPLSINRLPMDKFPHGRLYRRMTEEEKKNVVNFHANLPGVSHEHKVEIFVRYGLWYPAETESTKNDPKPWTPVNETSATRWTIVVSCTSADYDICLNWLHQYQKLNMENKVLLVAMDDEAYQRAKDVTLDERIWLKRVAVQSETSPYHDEDDTIPVQAAPTVPAVLKALVQAGRNVIYTKPDVVWLKNPIPHFNEEATYYFGDIYYHPDSRWDCTFGFIAISSSHRTIQFLSNWERLGDTGGARDPGVLETLTLSKTIEGTGLARMTKLPSTLFPPIMYYYKNLNEKQRQDVVVFSTDNRPHVKTFRKMAVLKENGLWYQ